LRAQTFDRKFLNSCLFLRMCGENMPKTRLRCCQIDTILVLLQEIVVAEHDCERVFRPEAELTLFLRMRTKEIVKTAKMYSNRRVIPLLQEMGVAEANGVVRFLTGSS